MAAKVADGRTQRPTLDRRLLLILPAFMLSTLAAGLDQTAIATALPTIAGDLGGLEQLSWVVTTYSLAIGVSTPIHGKLGDLFDRKRLFQLALLIFLIGSILCGIAQSMAELVLFRALQGIGAGGVVVNSQAILGELIAPAERGRYVGFTQSAFVLSTVAGPVVGGLITEELSWRWVFYLNLPICLAAFAVVSIRLSLPRRSRGDPHIDWWGAATFSCAVSGLMLVADLGGKSYAWTSGPIVGLAIGAAGLLVACGIIESRVRDPILPVRMLGNSVFRIGIAVVFIVGFATAAATIFIPLYLQVVLGYSPGHAGLLLAPLWFTWGMTATLGGHLMARSGRYRLFPILGTISLAGGLATIALLNTNTAYYFQVIGIILIGIGLGLINAVMLIALQNAASANDVGVVTSATTFSQTIVLQS